MTIHTAKGLEFDIVFICGLVDGQFPSRRLRNEDELEEERRLFYVAVTRAKTRLYLSSYAAKSEGFPVRRRHLYRILTTTCWNVWEMSSKTVRPHRRCCRKRRLMWAIK